ncbi:DUF5058 family protein [bacterium]|nr:DUF5058 family protein [bacterium]
MDNYLSIANGFGMWVACTAIIVVVLFQTARFIRISFRAGDRIGLPRAQMVQALRTGIISAIVPSIALLVGVAVLIPKLGVPFPWMRLSVIGSVIYELFAVEVAATAMGLKDSTAAFDGQVYAAAVWTMSMGFIFCLLFVALFTPSLKKIKDRLAGNDEGWMTLMNSAAFFGAFGFLWGQPIARGGLPLIALLTGFVCMVIFQVLIRYARQSWLKEWALSVSILIGMTAVGIAHHWHGTGG